MQFEVTTGEKQTCEECKAEICKNVISFGVKKSLHDSEWRHRTCFQRYAQRHGLKVRERDIDGLEGLTGEHREACEQDLRKINSPFAPRKWTIRQANGRGKCTVCSLEIKKRHPQLISYKRDRHHLRCTRAIFDQVEGVPEQFQGWDILPDEVKEEVKAVMERKRDNVESEKSDDEEEPLVEEEESEVEVKNDNSVDEVMEYLSHIGLC
ncbi:unnamed protein product [Caenorhabditis brenneri]